MPSIIYNIPLHIVFRGFRVTAFLHTQRSRTILYPNLRHYVDVCTAQQNHSPSFRIKFQVIHQRMSQSSPPTSSGEAKSDATSKLAPEKSLEERSSWISYIFFFYLDTLFGIGYRKTLELSDLGGIPEQNRADVLYKRFEQFYAEEKKYRPAGRRSLWNILWKTVGYWRLFLAIALFGVYASLLFGPVLILTRLVRYFQGADHYDEWSLWLMVALLFVFPMVASIALAHSNAIMCNIGSQVRNTLINIIYRKSLVISPYSKQAVSTGRILTMFSDDTNQIRNFLYFANNFALAPFQIGACLYLIYEQVGAATFVGLAYSFVTTPITGIIFKIVFSRRELKMKYTDTRVKLMNEVLNGIRIIKYYAWEGAFIEKIKEIRDKEVYLLRFMGYLFNSTFALLLLGAPQTQTILIFYTYIAQGNQLDAARAFTTLTLFGLMTSPFIFLPFGIQQYSQSLVSTRRILDFLEKDELEDYIEYADTITDPVTGKDDVIIQFDHANLSWTPKHAVAEAEKAEREAKEKKEQDKKKKPYEKVSTKVEEVVDEEKPEEKNGPNRAILTLNDLNISIKKGQLVGIVGTVGSGKSSILTAILGEMHRTDGHLRIAGKPTIAYCDQRPWIVNATVKDNVIFGKEYDESKFQAAIDAACMKDDIKILTAGVQTEIGERGINLSGGQKTLSTVFYTL
jgi:ATP-binding cassette subfamily C (CFTR/MRP) protein 1